MSHRYRRGSDRFKAASKPHTVSRCGPSGSGPKVSFVSHGIWGKSSSVQRNTVGSFLDHNRNTAAVLGVKRSGERAIRIPGGPKSTDQVKFVEAMFPSASDAVTRSVCGPFGRPATANRP